MNYELVKKSEEAYNVSEKKAVEYYKALSLSLDNKDYAKVLIEDINWWKKGHIKRKSLTSIFLGKGNKPSTKDYRGYIKWLDYTGKLDSYLDRSISYIFMRDLGKALDFKDTKISIDNTVSKLKNHLLKATPKGKEEDTISMASLYKKAKDENIESTMIWLIKKLKKVNKNIPEELDSGNAIRKIVKIIAGVVMHQVEEFEDDIDKEERRRKIDESIRIGYAYGLTYPFIDDLFDAKILSKEEEKQYSDIIRTTLITGVVPELGEWIGDNSELITFIHSELREAFKYIKECQSEDNMESFLNMSYVFFNSQEIDRNKDLSNSKYTNEEIYIPVILKSSASRLIVRSVIGADKDSDFESRTFLYGIYNQLADDFTDMFDDSEKGAVTPYTYYMKYKDKREDLINPFELYWTVIYYLIHNVYNSDKKTCEVILDRAINSLKRCKERLGVKEYNNLMEMLDFGNSKFNDIVQNLVDKCEDVDFFDKLLRDHIIEMISNEKNKTDKFLDDIEEIKNEINKILKIKGGEQSPLLNENIVASANYSIFGEGKRIRPILTWMIGVDGYGLNKKDIYPLLKSLEYMHTASLILDDLPSQDNAKMRRGHRTLHEKYDVATAELTSIFLTQQAIFEQASLEKFSAEKMLKLIRYSTEKVNDMCKGQSMDLNSRGKALTVEELKTMCFYKTGIAFEAAIVMPAILAGGSDNEIEVLKEFAYYAGIAFQIKDDILDVTGDSDKLGKIANKDLENNNSTFVSVLGEEVAEKELWNHYCESIDILKKININVEFLKQLMNYIVNRES